MRNNYYFNDKVMKRKKYSPFSVKRYISIPCNVEKFEEMLQAIQKEYKDTVSKMEQLRAAGKIKTATYKQLMGTKIMLQNMLSRYEIYGLLER